MVIIIECSFRVEESWSSGRGKVDQAGKQSARRFVKMKYGKVTIGQVEAAINRMGGIEVWDAFLRGEKTIVFEEAIPMPFDQHGRRITTGLQANFCDAARDTYLNQPRLAKGADFADRIRYLQSSLGIETGVATKFFQQETRRLLELILQDPQTAKMLKGVYLPVICPKLTTEDIGAELEYYLTGVDKSYGDFFETGMVFKSRPNFYNRCKDELADQVQIVDGSRADQLIDKMKESPVIGIYFPTALAGFSTYADREQMSTLPPGFILSGLDIMIAMIMYPDVLAYDHNAPTLELAAFSWLLDDSSLIFSVVDSRRLYFQRHDDPVGAGCGRFGGLLFIG